MTLIRGRESRKKGETSQVVREVLQRRDARTVEQKNKL